MIEFLPYAKTPRLYDAKGIVITEKIDGTNGAVVIEQFDHTVPVQEQWDDKWLGHVEFFDGDAPRPDNITARFFIGAQSRKRLLTRESDNFGFAKWVFENKSSLVRDLGEGTHFGEWWGSGIQRTYGQKEKFFSLFNVRRWSAQDAVPFVTPNLRVVPVIAQGAFSQSLIEQALVALEEDGSECAHEDWTGKAEGVIVFHTAAQQVFKAFCEGQG